MTPMVIRAEPRSEKGKGAARRLRRAGQIPGVIYGVELGEPSPVAVDAADLERTLAAGGFGQLVELGFPDGNRRQVLLKDLQIHPVRGDVIHADFHQVNLKEAITTPVPVVLTGEETRGNDGGVVTFLRREVQVTCLPTDIPDSLTADVSSLKIGDSLQAKDLPLPEGVSLADDPEEVIVTVLAPRRAEPAEAETEAGEAGGAEEEQAAGE